MLSGIAAIGCDERKLMLEVLKRGVLPCFAGRDESVVNRLLSSTLALSFAACGLRLLDSEPDVPEAPGSSVLVTVAGLLYYSAWYVLVYASAVHTGPKALKTRLSQSRRPRIRPVVQLPADCTSRGQVRFARAHDAGAGNCARRRGEDYENGATSNLGAYEEYIVQGLQDMTIQQEADYQSDIEEHCSQSGDIRPESMYNIDSRVPTVTKDLKEGSAQIATDPDRVSDCSRRVCEYLYVVEHNALGFTSDSQKTFLTETNDRESLGLIPTGGTSTKACRFQRPCMANIARTIYTKRP
ncbi:hypothetical protein F2P81_018436 [Scophthalmus maximus]|uniref:Uncharacterized protein n=1 Tax=Scophthalmus maximus TaxID=52904 RepID=A0A6A4SDY2_SCOMX|nr:hypothetical protein F2P81_018436 [Scophthalmus maximus]